MLGEMAMEKNPAPRTVGPGALGLPGDRSPPRALPALP